MPWLVMIGHTSSGDGLKNEWGKISTEIHLMHYSLEKDSMHLLAVNTLHGELLFVTGHAVVIVLFRDEALGANRLLAALAGEAGFMPAVSFMLHLPGAWRRGLDM